MAIKLLDVGELGKVRFQKRRGTKSIRVSVSGSEVRVTLPFWVSYQEAVRFVKKRQSWILGHRRESAVIVEGALIGKQHTIEVAEGPLRTRVTIDKIMLAKPSELSINDTKVQLRLTKACERALTQEANHLILPRLTDLAYEHGFKVNSAKSKKLERRWGSCDREGNIMINIYLAQLPWKYIDYVIFHELVHTQYFDHSPEFWTNLDRYIPASKSMRNQMRDYHPQLLPQ